MPKADILIHTKLHLPFTRAKLVIRPRLQARIAEGLASPLTLITAPAGFGETTLVASWIAICGMPVAWLSLDKDDNQVERFLSYLVAALQKTDNTVGSQAAQLLTAVERRRGRTEDRIDGRSAPSKSLRRCRTRLFRGRKDRDTDY